MTLFRTTRTGTKASGRSRLFFRAAPGGPGPRGATIMADICPSARASIHPCVWYHAQSHAVSRNLAQSLESLALAPPLSPALSHFLSPPPSLACPCPSLYRRSCLLPLPPRNPCTHNSTQHVRARACDAWKRAVCALGTGDARNILKLLKHLNTLKTSRCRAAVASSMHLTIESVGGGELAAATAGGGGGGGGAAAVPAVGGEGGVAAADVGGALWP